MKPGWRERAPPPPPPPPPLSHACQALSRATTRATTTTTTTTTTATSWKFEESSPVFTIPGKYEGVEITDKNNEHYKLVLACEATECNQESTHEEVLAAAATKERVLAKASAYLGGRKQRHMSNISRDERANAERLKEAAAMKAAKAAKAAA